MTPTFNYKIYSQLSDINDETWQACFSDHCFISYPFLQLLEQTHCVSTQTGWQPFHIVIFDDENNAVATLPGYIKDHSYGEYVFDWAWADAYQKYGLDYYPKWVCGVPFTPVTENRIGVNGELTQVLVEFIHQTLNKLATKHAWSGWHINFCHENEQQLLSNQGAMPRRGVQFSWHNRDYQNFNDFLAHLTARKRKSIKKERQKALSQIDEIKVLTAAEVTDHDMALFYQFYANTYLKRSGHTGYLTEAFFNQLYVAMRDNLVLVKAYTQQQVVAASLFFKHNDCLFGRYWGAIEEFDCLHFELCYYQGIEYSIGHKLRYFNAGAQGEHKILRGFEPEYTYSAHHITSELFQGPIDSYLKQEWQNIAHYKTQCSALLPFNKLK